MDGRAARRRRAACTEGGESGGPCLVAELWRPPALLLPLLPVPAVCSPAPPASLQLRAHHSPHEYLLTFHYFWPRVLVTSVAWGLSGFAVSQLVGP